MQPWLNKVDIDTWFLMLMFAGKTLSLCQTVDDTYALFYSE